MSWYDRAEQAAMIEAYILEANDATHYQTASSTVACGYPMRQGPAQPYGWDLGTVTVDIGNVDCERCTHVLARRPQAVLAGRP